MSTYIKIDRKILNWEWFQDVKVFHFFLYLLLKANHKDGSWQGIEIKRGQVLTGRLKLNKDTGLSEREIRTCIEKLKKTKEIVVKSTSKFSVVTICKYEFYQSNNYQSDQQIDQQTTSKTSNERPTNDQQTTTNNNVKNNKEERTTTTVVEMGIVLVKKVANDVWGDKAWMESLCMSNGMKMTDAKDWMMQFNLSISQDSIEGFDAKRYKKLFQGWLRMKLSDGQKITKVSTKQSEEKEMMKKIGL